MAVNASTVTLTEAAARVLTAASPAEKCRLARDLATSWRSGACATIGASVAVDRPARPDRPELRPPRDMKRRGKAASEQGRIALLHALAHIELNAVDLAADLIARFGSKALPTEFFTDWIGVMAEEAHHFELLSGRLAALGAAYGDLPAHDGLWEAAGQTSHDLLARLAVVPLVLEARALDVTPATLANLRRAGDAASAAVLEILIADEIRHVAIGRRWFEFECARRGVPPLATYHALVRHHFPAGLRPPFNAEARASAGLTAEFYEPLARRPD